MAKTDPQTATTMHNRYYAAGGFGAIVAFFANFVNFGGRSTRREYWWWTLWYSLFSIAMLIGVFVAVIFSVTLHLNTKTLSGAPLWSVLGVLLAYLVLMLVLFVPSLSLTIRRYRDAGFPWWLYVIQLMVNVAASVWAQQDNLIALGVEILVGLSVWVLCIFPTKTSA